MRLINVRQLPEDRVDRRSRTGDPCS